MREERGQLTGNVTIYEPYTLWGSIIGNVTVVKGGKFYARGAIFGNLIVENGGRVHVFGQIQGNITLVENTKLIHSGTVSGNITNSGGRLMIEKVAKVEGKVKTNSGETAYE